MSKLIKNFVYPDLTLAHRRFGKTPVKGVVLMPSGDWRSFLPPEERQNKNGIETSACYVEASQHTIATIEEATLGETDNNYSAWFNALLSDGSPEGGDPIRAADSFRHDGLVTEEAMPFSDTLKSWNDFHSWLGVNEKVTREEAKQYLVKKGLSFDLVIERSYSLETKYRNLREALKYSPCPISVYGEIQGDTYIPKPDGVFDTHLVEAVYVDSDNCIWVWDTYAPFLKKLPANYNSDFGMRWAVAEKNSDEQKLSLIQWILNLISKVLPMQIVQIQEIKRMTNIEKLITAAKNSVGLDLSPKNLAPQELSCAEGLSAIIHSVIPSFPTDILSTLNLKAELDKSPYLERVYAIEPGVIIVSPRTETVNGHCGVFIENKEIISNDSSTGNMAKNYTWNEWITEFKDRRGLRIYLWKVI